ncbi:MAG TPA: cytidylate kinase-like family protein [Gemmatales bacterium]|nr:cytidylate kinase-like family protein [Gemmatales bacterium]
MSTDPRWTPGSPLPQAAPLHGFRLPPETSETPGVPLRLTVAISRETGSRGILIAQLVAQRLKWQLYKQETLEYLAHDSHVSRELFEALDDAGKQWVDDQIARWADAVPTSMQGSMRDLARVIFAIGARGEAVILGRGAGFLLPSASTLHVRIIAPLMNRIGFLTQLERLTPEQAAEQVALRDERRTQLIATTLQRRPDDLYQYDLIVNSSMLGEALSAEMLANAAQLMDQQWQRRREADEAEADGP